MKAILVLEDGFTLTGQSFTGPFETGGEVIFTTGMTGYQEVLTDPSYCGQMICMTYPLIGNYGINDVDMESSGIHATALIVKECCKRPSNWRSSSTLPDFLKKYGTPGMEAVDTRALTRHIRLHGAMRGIISTKELSPEKLMEKVTRLPTMLGQNLVKLVGAKKKYTWVNNAPKDIILRDDGSYDWQGSGLPLIVYDYGIKWNILRHLCNAGFEPLVVPPLFSADAAVATGAKAAFLSNGPGDPATLVGEIEVTKKLFERMPVAGICLGHQIIAHALGGKTKKLKFGHHGNNHPVKDITTGKIEVSSQNHGFCVILDGMEDVMPTHVNLNDNTLEGLCHKELPIMSLQYHPEAAAGPRDSTHLFNRIRKMVDAAVGQ